MTRVGIDSNILIYIAGLARGPADDPKVERSRALFEELKGRAIAVAPVQAVGELLVVARRTGVSPADARALALKAIAACETPASDRDAILAAMDIVVDHRLQHWDALIVAVAAASGCSILLSEDMQHGFEVRGLTIVNPLAAEPHPKLATLLPAGRA